MFAFPDLRRRTLVRPDSPRPAQLLAAAGRPALVACSSAPPARRSDRSVGGVHLGASPVPARRTADGQRRTAPVRRWSRSSQQSNTVPIFWDPKTRIGGYAWMEQHYMRILQRRKRRAQDVFASTRSTATERRVGLQLDVPWSYTDIDAFPTTGTAPNRRVRMPDRRPDPHRARQSLTSLRLPPA